MKSGFPGLLVVLLVATVPAPASAAGAPASSGDGERIFLAQHCNTCHAVSSAGIERKMKASKAPDLFDVAAKEEAPTLVKYLKKKAVLNERKHPNPRALTLSDEELSSVVDWLRQQKSGSKK
jgi:mono/diheme cytochrome c family protein